MIMTYFERTEWKLFNNRVARPKLNIYNFIAITEWVDTFTCGL
jgi:hypothetical protein